MRLAANPATTPRPALCAAGELFGGVERHLLGMCTWLQRRGETPGLYLMHDAELAAQARLQGVEPVILKPRHSGDMEVPRRLAHALAAAGVNVVHAHGERAAVNCALARRHHRFVLVRTMHGALEPSRPWTVFGVKQRLYPWLERTLAGPQSAAVCYVTEDLRRQWRADQRGEKSLVIHNGLDPLDRADFRRPEGWPDDRANLVLIGRISAVKGIPFALEAMSRLRSGPRAHLHIIGGGPSEDEYRRLATERGLDPVVTFHGFRQNIHDYMAHATALLMPSLHEGLPYTILEAMSLGVPIVASDVGGLHEILADRETARLVTVGDTLGLAGAIDDLLADPAEAAALGERGRIHQARNLNLDQMGQRHWDLYARLTA